jgi:hypothetical protein
VRYLVSGLWHLAAAMSFAVAFGVFKHANPGFYLANWVFDLPLVVTSCAFFFVPDKWSTKGLMKFLHYPLPDWDVLLLGPASHRNWLTHSALLPVGILALVWNYPQIAQLPGFGAWTLGTCLGIGSHLFWDCIGSQRHKIVVVPYWFALRESASRIYLLCGAALSLLIGWSFASVQNLGL